MPSGSAQAHAGNRDVLQHRIRQRPLALGPAGRDDRDAIRNTVTDLHLADLQAREAAAVQADLEGGPPRPRVVVAAAPDEPAVLHDGRPAEVVVDPALRVGGLKGRADQDATSRGDVGEKAVLDPIVRATIERTAIGEKGQLSGRVPDHIVPRQGRLLSVPLVRSCGPHRITIVAGPARRAVLHDRMIRADAEIDAVGEQVAKPAAVDHEVAPVVNPHAGLRMLHPDAGHRGVLRPGHDHAVVGFVVVPVVQPAHDREVRDAPAGPGQLEAHAPAGLPV